MEKEIIVSISCITYNHANYIKQCLDGFLMQKCDFGFEILIHDDASNDGTSDIIREYQSKYPDIIKPIIQEENQHSKGVRFIGTKFNASRAQGKYLALCEGDDYWTDSYKLQKQVEFLETHPDYCFVAGGYISKNMTTGDEKTIVKKLPAETEKFQSGFDITLDRQLDNWLTKTLTVMYRNNVSIDYIDKYKYAKDVHLYYHLLKNGKGYYFSEVLGIYRVHEGGVFSLKSKESRLTTAYKLAEELYHIHRDRYSRKLYGQSIRNIIKAQLYKRNSDFRRTPLFLKLLFLTRDRVELGAFIWLLFKG